MNRQGSKLFWFLLFLVSVCILNVLFNSTLRTPATLPLVFPIYLLDSGACSLPNIDPFHVSFKRHYVRLPGEFDCRGKPSFLNRSGPDTVVLLQDVLRLHYNMSPEQLYCTYQPILHSPQDKFKLGDTKLLRFSTPIEDEFLNISCFANKSERRFWGDIIPLVPKRLQLDRNLRGQQDNVSRDTPSVLLIGLDSISRLNFQRNLPETYKFLVEDLNPTILYGYHVVGENSYPNLAALLTGTPYTNFPKNTFFDQADLVWKYYAAKGFRTLYLEDMTDHGTFNSLHLGFKSPPVHHYFRPAAYAFEHDVESKYFCYKNKLFVDIYLDYIKTFVDAMGPYRKFFAFVFLSRMFHDNINNPQLIDINLRSLLAHFKDSGVLNRTLLFLFSDHGFRMGPFRQTTMGQLESRLPAGFLMTPPSILKRWPEAKENLKANEHALLTAWDLHATLRHLINSTFSTDKGTSLFKRIKPDRNCKEAFIPSALCACGMHKALKPDSGVVKRASVMVVSHINSILMADGGPGLCSLLKSNEVLDAKAFSYLSDSVVVLILDTHPGRADSGVLNRTLLFLFSDHGFRMGPFRQTTKGQLESRLPAGFLMTPPSILKR
ncbi:hypothetical protein LAZ67_1005070 [Cordylochernes scorpioides]|uniref:Uncharacterized protein n=1 Tax=Cordylochernes scorpioides TaxID=51811 RepID=A0ABY6JXW0_9ARAC|nr:hypothetical protein LAZ67_1005070 [Cordylochernes scorpioides]